MQKFLCLLIILTPLAGISQFGSVQYIHHGGVNTGFYKELIAGDINNDGFPDILSSRDNPKRLELYINQGNGSFASPVQLNYGTGTIWCLGMINVNADPLPDIIFLTEDSIMSYLPNNNGQFGPAQFMENKFHINVMSDLQIVDMDHDGIKDLLLLEHFYPSIKKGLPSGGFAPKKILIDSSDFTEYYSLATGQFNNDTLTDFVIGSGGFQVYHNTGNTQFTLDSSYADGLIMDLLAAPFNNDQYTDLVTLSAHDLKWRISGTNGLQAPSLFQPQATHYTGLESFDVDLDGDYDLVAIYDQQDRIVWYTNDGLGNFSSEKIIHTEPNAFLSKIVKADINKDGRMDMIWAGTNGVLAFHLNSFPTAVLGLSMQQLQLFPNPARDQVVITSPEKGELMIYSTTGQLIRKTFIEAGRNLLSLSIAQGTYFIILNGKRSQYKNFLVVGR